MFEPRLELPPGGGFFDSIEPVRRAFTGNKKDQIKAADKAELPLVMVIGSANSPIDYGVFSTEGAMFGRPGIEFQVDPPVDDPESRNVFGAGGRVQTQ